MSRIPAVPAAALAVALAACSVLPNIGKRDSSSPTLGQKTVSAKNEPNELVSVDGTICTVDRKKFESVKVGDDVWCRWLAPSRDR